jgi:hypothetical protein
MTDDQLWIEDFALAVRRVSSGWSSEPVGSAEVAKSTRRSAAIRDPKGDVPVT